MIWLHLSSAYSTNRFLKLSHITGVLFFFLWEKSWFISKIKDVFAFALRCEILLETFRRIVSIQRSFGHNSKTRYAKSSICNLAGESIISTKFCLVSLPRGVFFEDNQSNYINPTLTRSFVPWFLRKICKVASIVWCSFSSQFVVTQKIKDLPCILSVSRKLSIWSGSLRHV